jgi:hypothetical protein
MALSFLLLRRHHRENEDWQDRQGGPVAFRKHAPGLTNRVRCTAFGCP